MEVDSSTDLNKEYSKIIIKPSLDEEEKHKNFIKVELKKNNY